MERRLSHTVDMPNQINYERQETVALQVHIPYHW